MSQRRKRRTNHGLRKVCGCPPRTWAKCAHPWHVNWTIDGVHIRKSLAKLTGRTITSKAEAEKAFDAYKVQLRESGLVRPDAMLAEAMTLGQLLDRYHADVLSRKPSGEDAVYQIATLTRTLLPIPGGARAFGAWPVGEVTVAELFAYKATRELKVLPRSADGTIRRRKDGTEVTRQLGGTVAVNRDLGLLRKAFKWARRVLPADVPGTPFADAEQLEGLFAKEAPRSRRLQGDEGMRLFQASGVTLRPLVEAALETGCRLGELLTLQWWQVDLRDVKPEIRLPAWKTKTKKDRTVPISARLRPILEMRRRNADGEPHATDAYVFGHQATGERLTTIKTAWRLTMKRSGIVDLHFHDLRREAGSRWLEAGIPIHTVSRLLGHTSVKQTATYLACVVNAEHDAIAAYDAHREAEEQRRAADAERRQQEGESRSQVYANGSETGVQTGGDASVERDTGPQESAAIPTLH